MICRKISWNTKVRLLCLVVYSYICCSAGYAYSNLNMNENLTSFCFRTDKRICIWIIDLPNYHFSTFSTTDASHSVIRPFQTNKWSGLKPNSPIKRLFYNKWAANSKGLSKWVYLSFSITHNFTLKYWITWTS